MGFELGAELSRDGELVKIARKPFALLCYLARHRDRVVPKRELLEQIWPGVSISDAAFSSALKDLRRVLGDDGSRQRVIRTVWGRGLRFVASGGSETKGPPGSAPPFVGRERELQHLIRCAEEAAQGRPQVVIVVGDAGAGKTRLVEELVRHRRSSKCSVAFGYCEVGSSTPYLPFVRALRALQADGAGEAPWVKHDDFAVLQRLLTPEPGTAPRRPTSLREDGARERANLFRSIWRTIERAAKRKPTLLAIEDLQHADSVSLELFASLAADVSDARSSSDTALLLVGTTQPPRPGSRLAVVIRRILAQSGSSSIKLSGLGVRATADLLGALGIAQPATPFPRAVHKVTGGNPLFIIDRVREADRPEALTEPVPGGLRTMIAQRLERLDAESLETLRVAAFIGERFGVSALGAAIAQSVEELSAKLRGPDHSGILAEDTGSFRFEHALVCEVLRDSTPPDRRREIHAKLGSVLEDLYASDQSEHAIEIAHHLVGAGELTDPDRLVLYAIHAGDQASAVCAWHDALYFYEIALDAQTRFAFAERADVHLQAGLVAAHVADLQNALDHYERASSDYRAAGDEAGTAWAALYAARTRFTIYPGGFGLAYDLPFLEDLLRKLGESEPALRALLLDTIATGTWGEGRAERAHELAQQALALGQRVDDDAVCHHVCMTLALTRFSSLRLREALGSWLDADVYARRARDPWLQSAPGSRIAYAYVCLGRFGEARDRLRDAKEVARRARNPAQLAHAFALEASLEFALGDFAATDEAARAALVPVERSHFPWAGAWALILLAASAAQRGAWDSAESSISSLLEPGQAFSEANGAARFLAGVYRMLIRSYRSPGDIDGASLAELVEAAPPAERSGYALPAICALVELTCDSGARELIRPLEGSLALAHERGFLFSGGWSSSIARLLGRCALLDGRFNDAEAALDRAVQGASACGARTELARAYLDRARLCARRADDRRDERAALADASSAAELAASIGMHPLEQQARRFARTPGWSTGKDP